MLFGGIILSRGEDETLCAFDLATGLRHELTRHARRWGVHVLRGDRVLWQDETLRVWDPATRQERVLSGHMDPDSRVVMLSDDEFLAWSPDGIPRAWNVETGRSRELIGPSMPHNVTALPDGHVLVYGEFESLRVWNLATGEVRVLLDRACDVVAGLLLLGARRLLSWGFHSPTLRAHSLDGTDQEFAFDLDARIWSVVPAPSGGLFIGDGLGGIHLLEIRGVEDLTWDRLTANHCFF
jgi:WD40 repeat protein